MRVTCGTAEVENDASILRERSRAEIHSKKGSSRAPAEGSSVVGRLLESVPALPNRKRGRQTDVRSVPSRLGGFWLRDRKRYVLADAEAHLGNHDTESSRISGSMNRLAHFDRDNPLRFLELAENRPSRECVVVPSRPYPLADGPPRPDDRDPPLALSGRATEVENEVHVLGDRSSNEVHDETGSGRGPAKGSPVVSGLLDPMPPLGYCDAGRQGDFFVLHVGLRRFLEAIDVLIPAGSIHLIDQEFEPTYSTCSGRLTIRRKLATLNRAGEGPPCVARVT